MKSLRFQWYIFFRDRCGTLKENLLHTSILYTVKNIWVILPQFQGSICVISASKITIYVVNLVYHFLWFNNINLINGINTHSEIISQ